ncbi:SprT family zinc-dependent metalloprotease [Paludicola sp. MB14-C6]|uniref:M48 family metallopeptidase n=1 Tax=Paludihabitans sp. MB14-C6 TaxID=3070656 RepID=UPI0027DE682E|nr:SprT family zinc-dependent metalloprotease [Paludicola sp. MB14-C6]WMJ23907.1 SprT family zinc-dependent metalloprotease [Paludicola sp. MB14-C6]
MTYQLVRSKRKTLAIHVLNDATIEVRAPLHLSKKEIESFLMQKQDWIFKKQEYMRNLQPQKPIDKLDETDMLWLQGREYPIQFGNQVQFKDDCFIIPDMDLNILMPYLVMLYKQLLIPLLQDKVAYYSKIMKVQPTTVKVNSAMKRWGSCSSINGLNFSFMLAMVQETELDYVVVHELAHIKQHNHSSAFWKEVEQVIPDYKQRQLALKEMQHKINTIW